MLLQKSIKMADSPHGANLCIRSGGTGRPKGAQDTQRTHPAQATESLIRAYFSRCCAGLRQGPRQSPVKPVPAPCLLPLASAANAPKAPPGAAAGAAQQGWPWRWRLRIANHGPDLTTAQSASAREHRPATKSRVKNTQIRATRTPKLRLRRLLTGRRQGQARRAGPARLKHRLQHRLAEGACHCAWG